MWPPHLIPKIIRLRNSDSVILHEMLRERKWSPSDSEIMRKWPVWLQNYEKSHRVQISAKLVECESALHRLQNYVEAMESPVSHIVGIGRTRFSNGLESGSRCCEFMGENQFSHIVGSRCGKVIFSYCWELLIFLILLEVQSGWKSLFAWCWE